MRGAELTSSAMNCFHRPCPYEFPIKPSRMILKRDIVEFAPCWLNHSFRRVANSVLFLDLRKRSMNSFGVTFIPCSCLHIRTALAMLDGMSSITTAKTVQSWFLEGECFVDGLRHCSITLTVSLAVRVTHLQLLLVTRTYGMYVLVGAYCTAVEFGKPQPTEHPYCSSRIQEVRRVGWNGHLPSDTPLGEGR